MAYDLEPLKGPRMAGTTLKVFAALAENPASGRPLRRLMLKTARIPALREELATEAPVVLPPLPRTGELERSEAEGVAPDLGALDGPAVPAAEGAFRFETAADFIAAYREGRATPEQVAERFMAAVRASESRDPPLRAFIATNPDDLAAQARASTARYREGKPLGPLDGVPVAVKDELDQVPYKTTVGTRFLGTQPAAADATVVARLRAAGALLVGKTNMHEIGLGTTGINPHHGTPRNPYDPGHVTGGSSSGSAAAVAAGLCPIAMGADGGGSIRIPSSFCGLVGLKATFSRVSEHGAFPLCWSLAHVGPLAASARDTALAYAVTAGRDPADPGTFGQPAVRLDGFGERDLKGLKIGVYRPWFRDADAPVVAACEAVLEGFKAAGAEVQEVEIPDLRLVRPVHSVTIALEMAASQARFYERGRRRYGLDVRLLLLLARNLASTDYIHAQRLRQRLCDHFKAIFKAVDVIATPTTAGTAPPLLPDALATGESSFETLDRTMRFITVGNLTGLPAISFPAGYDEGGLPIGIQVIGRPWHEHALLRLARLAEERVPRRAPRISYRLLEGPA